MSGKNCFYTSVLMPLAVMLSLTTQVVSAADGQWTVPICGAPNSIKPGWVPHGDPLANGTATITSQNSLITVDIDLGEQRYYAHHAHLYSTSNGYLEGSVDVGHSTVCWAYDNETPNNPLTAPYNEKSLSIANWPGPGSYAADWYKGYIDMIPEDGGDWYIMVHMLGGHFAVDEDGHLIPWDASVHEVMGRDSVAGNWDGENDVSVGCNARMGRRLGDTSVETGSCLAGTNGSYTHVDAPFLDQNGVAWLDENGELTQAAIDHGYDLDTEYLYFAFADEGISAQYGGPEGGAGGFLNPENQDPNRCLQWPPAGWGAPHGHGPDEVPPTLVLNGPASIGVMQFSIYDDPGAAAFDDRDGDISDSIQVMSGVDTSVLGTYTVSYLVSDEAGNSATASRTVTVSEYVDLVPPSINLIGAADLEIDFGATFEDPGATAFDNDDGDLTGQIQVEGVVDSDVSGNYFLVYSVNDAAGNTATVSRLVTVLPEPGLTLIPASPVFAPGEEIVIAYTEGTGSNRDWIGIYEAGEEPESGSSHNNYLAWAYTNGSEGSESFDSLPEGDYTAILFSDDSWDFYGDSASFSVGQAPDVTPPVIVLNGPSAMTLDYGAAYSEPGASATDDVDGNLTDAITIAGAVDTSLAGEYVLTYSVVDSAGNSSSTARVVTVSAAPEVDTVTGNWVKYIVNKDKLTIIASSSAGNPADGITLSVDGYGDMGPHGNKENRWKLVIRNIGASNVPETVTIRSSLGGVATVEVTEKL
ncbi:hypothetical protein GCM10007052_37590 [Halioglobus japonicus]|nr:immunoglobulin-like domain-containing protein [Halioglobus japonicus]GHD24163.1 hypothetical protein GCM10007052_37590 [Halioglobus japonicus]